MGPPFVDYYLQIREKKKERSSNPITMSQARKRIAAYYVWLFPNTMFNFYPWGISINIVRPLSVDRTKASFLTYVWDPSRIDRV
ncbi:MAG: SRPBCC family protein [Thermoanaerobaculia bacterium]